LRHIRLFEEFNIFEDEPELTNPPSHIIELAIQNDSKYLAYTDENGWFIADFLLEKGDLLDSPTFSKIKQFSVIRNVKKKKFGRNNYSYDIENYKPFDFLTNFGNLFK
jgi:hypothetical protein